MKQKQKCVYFIEKILPSCYLSIQCYCKIKRPHQCSVIMFDSKLTWAKHVAIQTNKANSALHAIKLIRKCFNQTEILSLLTSKFYSILFLQFRSVAYSFSQTRSKTNLRPIAQYKSCFQDFMCSHYFRILTLVAK